MLFELCHSRVVIFSINQHRLGTRARHFQAFDLHIFLAEEVFSQKTNWVRGLIPPWACVGLETSKNLSFSRILEHYRCRSNSSAVHTHVLRALTFSLCKFISLPLPAFQLLIKKISLHWKPLNFKKYVEISSEKTVMKMEGSLNWSYEY